MPDEAPNPNVKEHPILFSGPMVRAILEGRKTMTRRALKVQGSKDCGVYNRPDGQWVYTQCRGVGVCDPFECPYGHLGDRLWVRETWRVASAWDEISPKNISPAEMAYAGVRYLADTNVDLSGKMRPSIFMPRWASRITLEVTGVRVERVQDITDYDALSEGVFGGECIDLKGPYAADQALPKMCFANLWDSINAKRGFGWYKNPWVWVISFNRLCPSNPLTQT
jgi:hypothetical protein